MDIESLTWRAEDVEPVNTGCLLPADWREQLPTSAAEHVEALKVVNALATNPDLQLAVFKIARDLGDVMFMLISRQRELADLRKQRRIRTTTLLRDKDGN